MEKQTVYITGASGLVGRYLVTELLNKADFDVVAVSSYPQTVQERHGESPRFNSIGYPDFLGGEYKKTASGGGILVHCAFTRKNDPVEVKRSIDLAKSVFDLSKKQGFDGVLNISSRSIYKEPEAGELNTEESELNLSGLITIGKYTVELLAESILGGADIPYSSLRLASVNELKTDNNMVRPLNVFVDNMIARRPIRVVGGMQVMSFIAPQDVASAIRALLELKPAAWKHKYNVGTGWMCTDTLLNMAKLVVERGKLFGIKPVDINVEEKEVNQRAGLDISQIKADTGWKPVVSLTDMIDGLYKMKLETKE